MKLLTDAVDYELFKDIHIDFLLNYSVKLDTIVLNKNDVVDNFNSYSPLFLSFVLGIVILIDNGFFKENYFQFLNKVKEGNMKYVEGGRVWDLKKISSERLQLLFLKEKYGLDC